MSEDEVVVLVASGILASIAWLTWYVRALRLGQPPVAALAMLLMAPPVGGLLLFGVLRTVASHDVREDPIYLAFYLVMGAAWVAVWAWLFPLVGLSPRDDVLERANGAAADVTAGALLAITLCFAGGNIGDGPGWWVVLFSAGLATAALFLTWLLFETLTGVSDAVTIDRDRAAGIRLVGFLLACGVIFGRGAAGDWESASQTAIDFAAAAVPVIPLLIVAVLVERIARPTPSRPKPSALLYGAVPALVYANAAVLALTQLGLPA
jgi:uncharacterized membrane protein YjfL (UPF0719 family)